jgi:succinylarginine dihydrolase
VCKTPMTMIRVSKSEISLQEAVESYLFNSQIVTLPDQSMLLLAPMECTEIPPVRNFLTQMQADPSNPIEEIRYFHLHESMANGGGPACLRMRVVLTEEELQATHPHVFLDDNLYQQLIHWVEKHYRDRLRPEDLADPKLHVESQSALDELTQILKIGAVYAFQK